MLKFFKSNTAATWLSFFVLSSYLILITPLIKQFYGNDETSLWLYLTSITSVVFLLDLGFGASIIRASSYRFYDLKEGKIDNISDLVVTARKIYGVISLIVFSLVMLSGIYFYSQLESINDFWMIWFLYSISSAYYMYSNFSSVIMQGQNEIAAIRFREASINMVCLIALSVLILFHFNFLWVVLARQSAFFVAGLFNERIIRSKRYFSSGGRFDRSIFDDIGRSAWRSGVGVLSSQAATQVSVIILSARLDSTTQNSLLYTLQILYAISRFSQAPFYSKLPSLSSYYSALKFQQLENVATKGFRQSIFVYFTSIFVISTLLLIKVDLPVINQLNEIVFIGIGIAFLAERAGAMYIQIQSVNNMIRWHIVNTISGAIFIAFLVFLFPKVGYSSLIYAKVIENMFFYLPISFFLSQSVIKSKILDKKNVEIIFMLIALLSLWIFRSFL